MPSRPAVRADDKRLAEPGKKRKKKKGYKQPRTVMERYVAGELKVADMDAEELKRGWFRNESGTFKGGRPKDVPRKFFDELRTEVMKRWNESLIEELEPSINALKEIRDNKKASADARHKSAIYLIERVAGKVPEKAEVKIEMAPWEIALDGILVGDDD